MKRPAPETLEALLGLRRQLEALPHGERAQRIQAAAAAEFGRSPQTLYRWLSTFAGYDSGRKTRADAGKVSLPENTLELLAGLKTEGVRANGKRTMTTAVAMNVLAQNDHHITVHASTINRALRARRLDVTSQQQARTHGRLRSLHPNHVHQIDPSLCLIYYMGGKQFAMREDEFYKNKPGNYAKVLLKVWRYVRYDHASGAIDARYYEAAGENQTSLFEFLLYTWGQQPNRLSHGIPKRLLWDKGSANTSAAICRLLDALGVVHETHAPGHSWVKGGVELANNLVEMGFESRLKVEPVDSVEALNDALARWVRDYNANAIQHVDCRVQREDGRRYVRDDLWHRIRPEELILLPERRVCAYFLAGTEETRTVRDLRISFKHPETRQKHTYDLRPWATELSQGDKVTVTPLLLREGALRLSIERFGRDPLLVEVEPMTEFDEYGRHMDNPVIGDEYRATKASPAEQAARRLAAIAYGEGTDMDGAEAARKKNVTPFAHANGGKPLVAHSHLGQDELPARLPRRGRELDGIDVAAARRAQVETAPIGHTAFLLRLKREHGIRLSAEQQSWLQQRYPAGIPEERAAALIDELRGGTADGRAAHG